MAYNLKAENNEEYSLTEINEATDLVPRRLVCAYPYSCTTSEALLGFVKLWDDGC